MNIEATIIAYLAETFEDLPVCAERPADPPESYLLVDKTGGELVNFINLTTIVISAIAPEKYDASQLIDQVRDAMIDITDDEADITSCSLESIYDDTDTALKDYRYTAAFNISHY